MTKDNAYTTGVVYQKGFAEMADIVDPNTGVIIDEVTQAKLQQWQSIEKQAKMLAEQEKQLRNELITQIFGAPNGKAGTLNIPFPNKYKLKCEKKLSYKINKDKIDEVLDEIESKVENGKLIAERLIKWEPSLSLTEYKLHAPDSAVRKLLDPILTIEDAQATLKLLAPGER